MTHAGKGLALVVVGLAACTVAAPRARAASDSPAPTPATLVTKFVPALPAGVAARAGSCWTQSIASSREDAWRCAMGDAIVDPCFSVAGRTDVVLCGEDPATGELGFPLRLDAPLPARTGEPGHARPWLLLLASGESCAPFTGTTPRAGDEYARWYCAVGSRTTGLVTRLERGRTWRAVHYAAAGRAERPKTVVVRQVWE